MQYIRLILSMAFLALGYSLIFWGLRLFRLYVTLMGIFAGAAVGMLLIETLGRAAALLPAGAVTTALLVLVILGGLLAWRLKKLMVFLGAGLPLGMLTALGMSSVRMPAVASLIAGAIVFAAAGITAIALYQRAIVAVISLAGVQSIIAGLLLRAGIWAQYFRELSGMGSGRAVYSSVMGRWMTAVVNRETLLYTFRGGLAIPIAIVVFALFAVYFQQRSAVRPDDSEEKQLQKRRFRHICYVYACLDLAAVCASAVMVDTNALLSDIFAFGPHTWTLPVFAVLSSLLVSWLSDGERPRAIVTRYLCFLAFALVAQPVISTVFYALGFSLDNAFVNPFEYYPGVYLIRGHLWLFASRCLFSLIIFPGLVFLLFLQSPDRIPAPDSVEGNRSHDYERTSEAEGSRPER